MRFDIYGRYTLEVIRDGDEWTVYRRENDKRRTANLVIPAELTDDEIATCLDDLLHEQARPGESITPLE